MAWNDSINLSNPALTSGLEWNMKVSEYTSKDLIDSFVKNFDTYWHDDEFVYFSPQDEEHGSYKNLVVAETGAHAIIVTGCIKALVSRISGTFIKNNSCIA